VLLVKLLLLLSCVVVRLSITWWLLRFIIVTLFTEGTLWW